MFATTRRTRLTYGGAILVILVTVSPSILGLFEGDVFYALVIWPATLLIMGAALTAGRVAYARIELIVRKQLLGWRQGPGTTRTLVVVAPRQGPVWYMIGLISFPLAIAWNAIRNLDGGWWPTFAGLATSAVLLLLSHWEFKAQHGAGARLYQDELDRRAGR
jgi:hypothetical protein